MDAIDRIRDFALAPLDRLPRSVNPGVAASGTSFDAGSRSPTSRRRRRPAVPTPSIDEPDEQEMCRLIRPYGFVVRVDAEALQRNRPALKLFRFADRRNPAGTFGRFADLMQSITEKRLTSSA